MKKENKYGISLINLKNKEYQHHFLIEGDFFSQFEEPLSEKAHIEVEVRMLKSETMIQLFFHFLGSIELICDRSLDDFDYPIDFEEKIIFKFGEVEEVISEEMEVIQRNRTYLELTHYFYEFINLAIPMKRLHPRFEEELEEEGYEGELDDNNVMMVYQSSTEKNPQEEKASEQSDPWREALKKLKKS